MTQQDEQPDVPFRRLSDSFWVAPQLRLEDFARAREQGIRTIINNRPDGEAPDQLSDAEAAEAADAAGLSYVHVPVVSGGIFPDHIVQMKAAVDDHEGPVLAYCRSGTRSCHLWALLRAQEDEPAAIVERARAAGYEISPMRPLLEQIARH